MARRLTDKDRQTFSLFMDQHGHCWGCGWQPRMQRPVSRDIWAGPLKLENHHIVGGSGRKHLRQNLARMCSLCHRLFHGDRIRISPEVVLPNLDLSNILWLKRKRDKRWYNADMLTELAIGVMPKPIKPDKWFISEYKSRQGGK